jgi:uncharacterized phage infection (PIP) family protein YhgE
MGAVIVSTPAVGGAFARLFNDEADRLSLAARQISAWHIVVAIAVVGLLIWLQSPMLVWVYIAMLLAVAVYGLNRLGSSLRDASDATRHLGELAAYVDAAPSPTRDDLLTTIDKMVSPDDRSNVPEAVQSLASGPISGDSIRIAAHSSFAHPTSELGFAAFLRTALVLGGLFGTVLFFALELGGSALAAGSLHVLLPGLRGALASTLTGILGSVVMGIVASRTERHIDELITETESFFSGPLTRILSTTPVRQQIGNETDLWESLRAEVETLVAKTGESYEKMSSDVSAHAESLRVLGQELQNLPAVVVPPELARLGDVVDRFAAGAESLSNTATILVETVASLGVFAPARMLQEMEQLNESVADRQRQTSASEARVETTMQRASSEISTVATAVSAVPHHLAAVADRLSSVPEQISTLNHAVAGLPERLLEIERGLDSTSVNVESLAAAIASIASASSESPNLEKIDHQLRQVIDGNARLEQQLSQRSSPVASRSDAVSSEFSTAVTQDNVRTGDEFQNQMRTLLEAASELQEQQTRLRKMEQQLNRLSAILPWYEKASHAPFVRLLTMSWRGNGRQPAQTDNRVV